MDAEIRLMLLEKARAGDTQAALVLALIDMGEGLQEALWDIASAIREDRERELEQIDILMPGEAH
jgi:hypothetical protein